MTTPVIYSNAAVDPFAHLNPEDKTTSAQVFYATNRAPQKSSAGQQPYGNGVSNKLHLGQVTVRMGDENTSWQDLYLASVQQDRSTPMPLFLQSMSEKTTIDPEDAASGTSSLSPSLQAFAKEIDSQLSEANDKEIMIYVHGAKGSFLKSSIVTAELDHFTGRDFVSFAFAWPSHQNIFTYFFGIDLQRAYHSSRSLQAAIEFLARHTQAEHINIICYSAGARVTSRALFEMRNTHSALTAEELKKTFRLGTILFAAADVPLDVFLERLPAIGEMAQNIVVTVSDDDDVLRAASRFMGGSERIGSEEAETREEAFVLANNINNFEIIDLSHGKEKRGFDITGHHYWYRHSWASSDIIFLLRTDLPAHQRGLEPSDLERIWYLSHDYPERVRRAAEKELEGQW